MKLTRRQTGALLAASLIAPSAVFAQAKDKKRRRKKEKPPPKFPDLMEKLGAALNGHLTPGCGGQFSVLDLDYGNASGGGKGMRAVVRLDWPPGFRQKPFVAGGADAQGAFDALVAASLDGFRQAWPDCIV